MSNHPFRLPISRLLPTRNRPGVQSTPNPMPPIPGAGTGSGSSTVTGSSNAQNSSSSSSFSRHASASASLPLRRTLARRSRSMSPAPSTRRPHRIARRFPKHSAYDKPKQNPSKAADTLVTLEALDDFFESFAPPSLRSFALDQSEGQGQARHSQQARQTQLIGTAGQQSESSYSSSSSSSSRHVSSSSAAVLHGKATSSLSRQPPPLYRSSLSSNSVTRNVPRGVEPPAFSACDSHTSDEYRRVEGGFDHVERYPHADEEHRDNPSGARSGVDTGPTESNGDVDGSDDELRMLRRWMQAELREVQNVSDSRFYTMEERVQATHDQLNTIERHIDDIRVRMNPPAPVRPSVELCMRVTDAVCSIILVLLNAVLATYSFLRRRLPSWEGNKGHHQHHLNSNGLKNAKHHLQSISRNSSNSSRQSLQRQPSYQHQQQLSLPELGITRISSRNSRNSKSWRLSNRDLDEALMYRFP